MFTLTDTKSRKNELPEKGVREDQEGTPPSADIAKDESEEGEIPEDLPVRSTKRRPSPSDEEHPLPKRVKPAPEPDLGLVRNMKEYAEGLPCEISVNQSEPVGELYRRRRGFRITLWITPGPGCAPTISLGFESVTSKGGYQAKCEWDTMSNCKGEWAMSHFTHGYLSPDTTDIRKIEQKVLDQCRYRDVARLLYVRFDSWSYSAGYSRRDAFMEDEPNQRGTVHALMMPRQSYPLEIWFLAPFNATNFRQGCLRYFTDALERRTSPHHFWSDPEGVCFTDHFVPPRPSNVQGKSLFRTFKAPPTTRTRDRATKWEDPSSQAGQSTGDLPLTAQDEKHGAQTLAHVANLADRSRSPYTEEQTVLTSEAGPNTMTTEGHQTSEPIPSFQFTGWANQPPCIRPMTEGFIPGQLDMESYEEEPDSDADADIDEDGEGQHEDEEEDGDKGAWDG